MSEQAREAERRLMREHPPEKCTLRAFMGLPADGSLPVSLGVGDGRGNLFVYGGYEAIKNCQDKLDALGEALQDKAYVEDELKHRNHQLADERSRTDCSTRGGWLSEDLECAGEDGPACWKHLLEEARGKLDAVQVEVDVATESGRYSVALVAIHGILNLDRILKGE